MAVRRDGQRRVYRLSSDAVVAEDQCREGEEGGELHGAQRTRYLNLGRSVGLCACRESDVERYNELEGGPRWLNECKSRKRKKRKTGT